MATKSEKPKNLPSSGVSQIRAWGGDMHVEGGAPASAAFLRVPNRPDIDEVRRATLRRLKTCDPDRPLTRAKICFEYKDLGSLLNTLSHCLDLQLIRQLCAYREGYVRQTWRKNRSLRDVKERLWGEVQRQAGFICC